MKTPTLKEVKEYFKNAEQIKHLNNKNIILSFKDLVKFYKNGTGGWNAKDEKGVTIVLYSKISECFAEILDKKEITIPISQIDALPNNDKLGEYVRSLRNQI